LVLALSKKAVIVYWSKSGNTEKVTHAIKDGLMDAGLGVSVMRTEAAEDVDYFDYDLVCVGFPSYSWHPPGPMVDFLKARMNRYSREGRVKIGCPKVPGKSALVFCTYSGPHTGIDEATPAGKYAAQFFEHVGFTVLGEWYVLGEFHGWEEGSTKGPMGDIRGKPTEEELGKIREDAERLGRGL
jgi:hypothetical protein